MVNERGVMIGWLQVVIEFTVLSHSLALIDMFVI